MRHKRANLLAIGAVVCMSITPAPLSAQDVLPRPEPTFAGFQGLTASDSSPPLFPAPVKAPIGAPNVLIIMTDDAGFAASSTFGGPVPTPTLDALAAQGLKYNQFNTSAVCSPTRAALLTGRNPHQVGMATVPEAASGYDRDTSIIPKSAATIAQVLKYDGFNTAILGKWHLTPSWERSIAGPFDHWPTQMGFEYFYGFLGGEVNQFAPELVEGTTRVNPALDKPDYILDRDLADHACNWILQQESVAPEKPFFMYYATGTSHAPHQAPAEWIARFKGRFDKGWDIERQQIFAEQKRRGIIPADAALTPRSSDVPAWNSLTSQQQAVAARFMEAYAGALSFADFQIGRIIDALRMTNQLDNTLIIFIQGDNGGSAIGGLYGSLNSEALYNLAEPPSIEAVAARVDEIGGPMTQNEYPLGWGHAMNTPFQFYKSVASHFGGIRNGMVMSWPEAIRKPGTIRSQFHYVTDIFPTILEATGLTPPQTVDGVKQMPVSGVSMVYSLNAPSAPSRRTTQYFEAAQNVGIYHDGWFAAAHRAHQAGMVAGKSDDDLRQRKWELYKVDSDFSQANDLASQNPKKLQAMQDLFMVEAARNQVFPLHSFNPAGLYDFTGARKHFTLYPGTTGIPEGSAPALSSRSFRITADVEIPPGGASGILATQGGRFAGFAFHMTDGKLAYTYNYFNRERTTLLSDKAIAPGRHKLQVRFAYDGGGKGKGGTATLYSDGVKLAEKHIARTRWGYMQSMSETFDVGEDTGTPVSEAYQLPNRFTGQLNLITVDLE